MMVMKMMMRMMMTRMTMMETNNTADASSLAVINYEKSEYHTAKLVQRVTVFQNNIQFGLIRPVL